MVNDAQTYLRSDWWIGAFPGLAIVLACFPRLLIYPLAALLGWIAVALLYRSYKLHRKSKQVTDTMKEQAGSHGATTGGS